MVRPNGSQCGSEDELLVFLVKEGYRVGQSNIRERRRCWQEVLLDEAPHTLILARRPGIFFDSACLDEIW